MTTKEKLFNELRTVVRWWQLESHWRPEDQEGYTPIRDVPGLLSRLGRLDVGTLTRLLCEYDYRSDLRRLDDETLLQEAYDAQPARAAPRYVEIPLVGGPRDGHVVRFHVAKDGTLCGARRYRDYKWSDEDEDGNEDEGGQERLV